MFKRIFIYYLVTLFICFLSIFINNEFAFVFGSMLGALSGGCLFYLPIIYGCAKWIRCPHNSAGLAFILSIAIFWIVYKATAIKYVSYSSSYGNSYGDLGIFLSWIWVATISGQLSRKRAFPLTKSNAQKLPHLTNC